MSERRRIQLVPMLTPQRHVLVHHLGEEIVVAPFDEVDELVDDQVLEAPHGLLHEFQIQPDPTGIHAARAPLGLHLLDAPVGIPASQSRNTRVRRSIEYGAINTSSRNYHGERNHQGLGHELIDRAPPPRRVGRVRRLQRLGGLLNYHCRAAWPSRTGRPDRSAVFRDITRIRAAWRLSKRERGEAHRRRRI
jgi:hypothetical protein